MHFPSRYCHRFPGGRSSSLVGAPSSALSLLSLVPASSMVGVSFASAAGAGVAPLPAMEGSKASVAADGVPRALDATWDATCGGVELVLRTWEVAGWDDVSRTKSSRALRATSHPDKSSSPIPTVCFVRLPILILFPQVRCERPRCEPPGASPQVRTPRCEP